jgi:protein-S-isoprenylcysteine O-methyltransferase Ste14
MGIRLSAQLTLSRSWSYTLETAQRHHLIKHGIYSLTGHPIYVSLIFWAIAQPVLLLIYVQEREAASEKAHCESG